jgi:hypothetical protein
MKKFENLNKTKTEDKKDKVDLFSWNTSLKKQKTKEMDWFLISEGFYFNEYWKVYTKTLIDEFVRKNKKKWQFLHKMLLESNLSLNFTWYITSCSWLWFTLDKIWFLSLSYNSSLSMIEIVSDDWFVITVTKNQEILTNKWYKKAVNLTADDELIWALWNSYNGFKTWKNKNNKYIDILWTLKSLKERFENEQVDVLELSKFNSDMREFFNIMWVKQQNKKISIQSIQFAIDNILWKNQEDYNLDTFISKESKTKNLFLRKIKSVKEIDVKNWYICNITTKLSYNYIISNVILKNK